MTDRQKQEITILPLADHEHELVNVLIAETEKAFETKVYRGSIRMDISDYFDAVRRQYNADELLKFVYECRDLFSGTKIIALVDVDLFIPILTFIFGQAYLGGDVALASSYRLKNERYGMPRNDELLKKRFIKEVLHELGHCYGLVHCLNPDCVMRSSTYVEDIDQKSAEFCSKCRGDLHLK